MEIVSLCVFILVHHRWQSTSKDPREEIRERENEEIYEVSWWKLNLKDLLINFKSKETPIYQIPLSYLGTYAHRYETVNRINSSRRLGRRSAIFGLVCKINLFKRKNHYLSTDMNWLKWLVIFFFNNISISNIINEANSSFTVLWIDLTQSRKC